MLRTISLKFRIMVAVALLSFVVMVSMALITAEVYSGYVKQGMIRHHFSVVSRIADQMEIDIQNARSELVSVARKLSPVLLKKPFQMRSFYSNTSFLRSQFDYGLLLFSADGKLIAAAGELRASVGKDFSQLTYIRDTISRKAPSISAPYISGTKGFPPVVMFTAPVIGKDNELVGILAGGMNLLQDNILARPAGIHIGEDSYLAVFTQEGTVVTHTERKHILASLSKPLPVPLLGEENRSIEIKDARGVSVLVTRKTIPATGWILASALPTATMLQPLDAARRAAYILTAIGTVVALLLTWMLVHFLMRGLTELLNQVQHIGPGAGLEKRVEESASDESGQLARAINHMLDTLALAQQRLEAMTIEVTRAETRERRRIATDLHDSICQTLALVNIQLGQLGARQECSEGISDELAPIRKSIEKTISDMRSLIFDLSPPVLFELGLAPAIEWYGDKYSEEHGISVTVNHERSTDSLPEDLADFLFRSVRELLVNVSKHTRATAVTVELSQKDGTVRITVTDNGEGFPARDAVAQGATGKGVESGFGLYNIRERLHSLGGEFSTDGAEGAGAVVTMTVPY